MQFSWMIWRKNYLQRNLHLIFQIMRSLQIQRMQDQRKKNKLQKLRLENQMKSKNLNLQILKKILDIGRLRMKILNQMHQDFIRKRKPIDHFFWRYLPKISVLNWRKSRGLTLFQITRRFRCIERNSIAGKFIMHQLVVVQTDMHS